MQKAKQRSEIAQQDKWRIEDIYATDEAWEADYDECIRRAKEKCVYQGRLAESAQILYQALKESDEADPCGNQTADTFPVSALPILLLLRGCRHKPLPYARGLFRHIP